MTADNKAALELCDSVIADCERNGGSCEIRQNTIEAIRQALTAPQVDVERVEGLKSALWLPITYPIKGGGLGEPSVRKEVMQAARLQLKRQGE